MASSVTVVFLTQRRRRTKGRSPESCLQNATGRFAGARRFLLGLGAFGLCLGSVCAEPLIGRRRGGTVPEAAWVKGAALSQHVVDSSSQACRQDAQRLGFAMLVGLARQESFGLVALACQQASGFGKGPLELRVADLGAAHAGDFARRGLLRSNQPRVREKVSFVRETPDVMNLIEQHQCENLADTRDTLQQVVAVRGLDLDGTSQVQFYLADQLVECIQQTHVDVHAQSDTGVDEAAGDVELGAIAGVDELLA